MKVLTALLLVVVSGCKIQVQVPDNGRVVTVSGNYLCESSQTCEIDVVDLLFDETFVAEPAEGYYFNQWHREALYLCGGLAGNCPLFTSGFEDFEILMDILASDEDWFLTPVFKEGPECERPDEEVQVRSTAAGIEFVRTPDACFEALDGYPFSPNYVDVEGLRYHFIEEGPADGEVVLMLHGQPSWSYLYRKMAPVLAEAGYRVIVPDNIGMGRSDKPVDPRVHQFEQQVSWLKGFVSALDLRNISLFAQDWGSHLGLRMAGDNPDNFARIVVANGNLARIPEGFNPLTVPVFEFDESIEGTLEYLSQRPSGGIGSFQHWMNFAASAPHLFAADMVQIATVDELTDAQYASYNAPYPSRIY